MRIKIPASISPLRFKEEKHVVENQSNSFRHLVPSEQPKQCNRVPSKMCHFGQASFSHSHSLCSTR